MLRKEWYKVEFKDGEFNLTDENGNKVPKQISMEIEQGMDEAKEKVAVATVKLWVRTC